MALEATGGPARALLHLGAYRIQTEGALQMYYAGIENSGIGVKVIVAGFGNFSLLASKYLAEENLGRTDASGILEIDPDQWYPVENFRRALKKIAGEVGEQVVKLVGQEIPKNAVFPPHINSIETALASLDAAMHMGHRKLGMPMFDMDTGRIEEGIGHLAYEKTPGKNEIIMRCDSPYPCAMDLGLVTAMAQRFQPRARVVHEPKPLCKDHGGTRCKYTVTW
jgi:hypothetical protein